MLLCCPKNSGQRTERKESLFLTFMRLSCFTPTKASPGTAHWTHIQLPAYSLCILSHGCLILLRKKTAQWKKNSSVCPWICVTTQSVLHAYIVVGEESLRVCYQPPFHAWQFPCAMRNPTHRIFVRLIMPLCVIIH